MTDHDVLKYPRSRVATFDVVDGAPAAIFTDKLVKKLQRAEEL